MKPVIPITRWIMICNGCGAPIEAHSHDDPMAMLPMFPTRKEALKASVEAYDETGQHPAVAEVVIRGV